MKTTALTAAFYIFCYALWKSGHNTKISKNDYGEHTQQLGCYWLVSMENGYQLAFYIPAQYGKSDWAIEICVLPANADAKKIGNRLYSLLFSPHLQTWGVKISEQSNLYENGFLDRQHIIGDIRYVLDVFAKHTIELVRQRDEDFNEDIEDINISQIVQILSDTINASCIQNEAKRFMDILINTKK